MTQAISKLYLSIRSALSCFWSQYPALYVATAFLTGVATAFHFISLFIGIILIFFDKRALTLLILGMGYLYCLFFFPPISFEAPLSGSGVFHIHKVKRHPTLFKPLLIYEGKLHTFQTKHKTFHSLPCYLYLPIKNRPLATQDYFLPHLSLKQIAPYHFLLKPKKQTPWVPIKNTKSYAEQRYQMQEIVRHWVKKKFHTKPVQNLITSLLCGQKESRLQIFQFSVIGLQHLLAISGFSFCPSHLFLSLFSTSYFATKTNGLNFDSSTIFLCLLHGRNPLNESSMDRCQCFFRRYALQSKTLRSQRSWSRPYSSPPF